MLFIDDRQPELCEFYILRNERVRPDHELQAPVFQGRAHVAPLAAFGAARHHRDAWSGGFRHPLKQAGQPSKMLLRQNLRGKIIAFPLPRPGSPLKSRREP